MKNKHIVPLNCTLYFDLHIHITFCPRLMTLSQSQLVLCHHLTRSLNGHKRQRTDTGLYYTFFQNKNDTTFKKHGKVHNDKMMQSYI